MGNYKEQFNTKIDENIKDYHGYTYRWYEIEEAQEYIDKNIHSEEDVAKFVRYCVEDINNMPFINFEAKEIILHHFDVYEDVFVSYQIYYEGFVAECSVYWDDGEIDEDRSYTDLTFQRIHDTETTLEEVNEFFRKCFAHEQDFDWWDFCRWLGDYYDDKKVDPNSDWDLSDYDNGMMIRRI